VRGIGVDDVGAGEEAMCVVSIVPYLEEGGGAYIALIAPAPKMADPISAPI
jgi:hypothetical protein